MSTDIKLKQLTANDTKDFYSLVHSDPVEPEESPMVRFLQSYVQDEKSTKEMIQDFSRQYDGKLYHYYMIQLDGKSIGFVSAEYSRIFHTGFYVTYFLGKDFRGNGYMETVIELLFEKLAPMGLPCIFDIDANNYPSRTIIEKIARHPIDSYVDGNKNQFLTYLIYP